MLITDSGGSTRASVLCLCPVFRRINYGMDVPCNVTPLTGELANYGIVKWNSKGKKDTLDDCQQHRDIITPAGITRHFKNFEVE